MSKYGRNTENPMDVSKGVFVTQILADPIVSDAFFGWMETGASAEARHTKRSWDNSENVTLDLAPNLMLVEYFRQVLNATPDKPTLGDEVRDRYYAIKTELETSQVASKETPIPTAVHEVYAIDNGFGYKVLTSAGGQVIVIQPHLPASAGNAPMTNEQASLLGWTVAEKIRRGIDKSISISQQTDIITKAKTPLQVVDAEDV